MALAGLRVPELNIKCAIAQLGNEFCPMRARRHTRVYNYVPLIATSFQMKSSLLGDCLHLDYKKRRGSRLPFPLLISAEREFLAVTRTTEIVRYFVKNASAGGASLSIDRRGKVSPPFPRENRTAGNDFCYGARR